MQWGDTFRTRANSQRWDWHVVLFFLNVFLVVYGYSLREGAFQAVKAFRTLLVVVSLAGLFFSDASTFSFDKKKNWVLWGFVGLIAAVAPFSVNFFWSLGRLAAWLPFLIYANYFVVYLFTQYTKDEALIKLLQVFNLAYFYPVGVMFFYGVMFQTENIYGQNIGTYKANVLGWSCGFFVLTGFDLYANRPMSAWLRNVFFGIALITLWGVVLTGSRSTYIALAAAALVLALRSSQISVQLKGVITLCLVAFAYYIITSPDSVINLRSQYAEIRQQKGEIRFELAQKAIELLWAYPGLLFTGFGFDNFRAGLATYGGIKTELASHNSYLELLFGSGLFVFGFFMIFLVFNALQKYVHFDSRRFVFMPMLFIVPYFESNLNAGQFLFFPWMTFLFYYAHVTSTQSLILPKAKKPLKVTDS
jgi:O-Antigen ligase